MYAFINLTDTIKYVSKDDPDRDDPAKATIFVLGALDGICHEKINDMATTYEFDPRQPAEGKAKTVFNYNEISLDILRLGLRDIQNAVDPQTNKPLKFDTVASTKYGKSRNIVADSIIAMMPKKLRAELVKKIREISNLSEEEEKNS